MLSELKNMAVRPKIKIDIVSDNICPWCYIGKRRIEKAMSQMADKAEFAVQWKPFFLDPTLPEEGVDKMTRYREKFGPRIDQMIPVSLVVSIASIAPHISSAYETSWRKRGHQLLIRWQSS